MVDLMTENIKGTQTKFSMSFDEDLLEKDKILGKTIQILSVGNAIDGEYGTYRIARISFEGIESKIILGGILCKELDEFNSGCDGNISYPLETQIVKPTNKKYYVFKYLAEI